MYLKEKSEPRQTTLRATTVIYNYENISGAIAIMLLTCHSLRKKQKQQNNLDELLN
jgi:hypothetical protein